MLANIAAFALVAVMAQAAYAADHMSTQPTPGSDSTTTALHAAEHGVSLAAARAGGRITFIGAIVVGTAATPAAVTPGTSGAVMPRAGWYGAPSRQVTIHPLQQSELSPQIDRLELPDEHEHLGPMPEVVVTYK